MHHPKKKILEVCIATVYDGREAVAGGADRLELNSALELGGLTPSLGLFARVKSTVGVPVVVMIRPRAAGFCYDDDELATMQADAERLLEAGADGIVFGVLDSNQNIDVEACRRLVAVAQQSGRETIFHRAFDLVPDADVAVEQLIELGVTRLLTSGQAEAAIEGAAVLSHLQQTYGDRIEILPAAGINPDNVQRILHQTGCTQVHGSFGRSCEDEAGVVANSIYRSTDRAIVQSVCDRLG